jgi:hypothetical protein
VLGITGRILDQDSFNIPKVQAGLRASPIDGLTVAVYQESRIRHMHSLFERYIDNQVAGPVSFDEQA